MKIVLFSALLPALMWLTTSFSPATATTNPDETEVIKWYTWEEAIEANEQEPRKLMVDIYTSWCGWCKQMDKKTFTNPEVIEFINKNYYPIKFNAEQREDITYKGQTLTFKANAGRRGAHELAIGLLDGRMGYPTLVYLDEQQQRITISPGFKDPDKLMLELKFVEQEVYKTDVSFAEFSARNKKR